jgi:hypothetical protein
MLVHHPTSSAMSSMVELQKGLVILFWMQETHKLLFVNNGELWNYDRQIFTSQRFVGYVDCIYYDLGDG